MPSPHSTGAPLSVRGGLLYAAGDIGPSLTSLCLAFYWLYFLIEVAHLPVVHAGLIHSSGYFFSSAASLWTGDLLDRRIPTAEGRCRLISAAGIGLALSFLLLWVVPGLGSWNILWYLALSWLFHLLFALVYVAYLSLTPALAHSEKERVDLNSYRFAGAMSLSLALLSLHGLSENRWPVSQRLFALAAVVALLGTLGSILCGIGLKRPLGQATARSAAASVPWLTLARSPILWWAVGGNLAVWFMVQTVMVLSVFLCKAAQVSDGLILLLMQFSIIVSAVLASLANRRWSQGKVMGAASLLWCLGATCWWLGMAPVAAAVLIGAGLGAATVISWAKLPDALDRFAQATGTRADGRTYAGLTVLRDLVSAIVPLLATSALDGHPVGSPGAGETASLLLMAMAAVTALALPALQWLRRPGLPAAGAGTAEARS